MGGWVLFCVFGAGRETPSDCLWRGTENFCKSKFTPLLGINTMRRQLGEKKVNTDEVKMEQISLSEGLCKKKKGLKCTQFFTEAKQNKTKESFVFLKIWILPDSARLFLRCSAG